jgi:TRAP transporter TAXI family solute receptor
VLVAEFTVLALAGSSAFAAEIVVNVLTAGTSSVYYTLGVALANAIGKALPGVKASVQATKGSVENLNLLEAGRGEIGFTLGDSLSDAWKGNEEAGFKSPLKKLRGIASRSSRAPTRASNRSSISRARRSRSARRSPPSS